MSLTQRLVMSERNAYKRFYTIKQDGEWFKIRVFDEYGFNTTVYEKNVIQASLFIIKWWESTEERKNTNDLMSKAILNCKEIDSKNNNLREIL